MVAMFYITNISIYLEKHTATVNVLNKGLI